MRGPRGCQPFDITIVTTVGKPTGRAVEIAEEAKRCKDAAELAKHPYLGFAAVAFDLLGGIGPSA